MAKKKSLNSVSPTIASKGEHRRVKPWRGVVSLACGLGVLLLSLFAHLYQEQREIPLLPLQTTNRPSFLERSPEREFSCVFEMKMASELESVVPVMNLTQNQLFIMLNGGRLGFIFKYSNIYIFIFIL